MATDIVADGRMICAQVVGDSMRPLFQPGDYLLIEPVGFKTLVLGDVVLFRDENRLVVHRLIRRWGTTAGTTTTQLLTKGDACRSADIPITESQVLGRVVALLRGNRSTSFSSPLRVAQAKLLWFLSTCGRGGCYARRLLNCRLLSRFPLLRALSML